MPTRDGRRGGDPGGRRAALALAFLAAGFANSALAFDRSTCKFFSQLPDDCAAAEQRKYDNLRGYRFVEIDLYARDVIKKILYVSIYNTTGQNDGDDTRDSAPQDFAEHVSPGKVARQYQGVAAWMSPPRYWAVDWFADRVGAVRNFDGLDAAWMGNGQAAESKLSRKPPPDAYRTAPFPRTAIEGFKKGTKVYLLDDSKGQTWVLASYTAGGAPNGAVEGLDSLGERLRLPQGWKFRSVTLDKELILEPKGGYAASTQDDRGDVYHLAGPGQSNFTP
jgi:hypothetical protein